MSEVRAEEAYAAALDRVHRLTDALIGAEARLLTQARDLEFERGRTGDEHARAEVWRIKYENARDRGTRWRRRYVDAVKGTADRDQEELDQEAEEVGGNGTTTCGYAETIGETVRPGDVPEERVGVQGG